MKPDKCKKCGSPVYNEIDRHKPWWDTDSPVRGLAVQFECGSHVYKKHSENARWTMENQTDRCRISELEQRVEELSEK